MPSLVERSARVIDGVRPETWRRFVIGSSIGDQERCLVEDIAVWFHKEAEVVRVERRKSRENGQGRPSRW